MGDPTLGLRLVCHVCEAGCEQWRPHTIVIHRALG
jgi:hypothetical protein